MYKLRSENGSYTIEACVSLFFFLITIYFVFLQVNTFIVESVLQKAANNMAKEIAGYSYILDKTGIIPQHSDGEMNNTQGVIDSGTTLFNNSAKLTDTISGLYSGELYSGSADELVSGVESVGSSLSEFIKIMTGYLKDGSLKTEGGNAVRYLGEQSAKKLINTGISSFCEFKINSYLPSAADNFKKRFGVTGNFDFSNSMYMPTDKNNSVYIEVRCKIRSPFNVPGVDLFSERTIVKTSYALLWVSSNTNTKYSQGTT